MQEFILKNFISIIFIGLFVYGFIKGFGDGFLKKVLSFGSLIATIIATKVFTPGVAEMIKDVTNIESTLSDIIFRAFIESSNYDKLNLNGLEKIFGTGDISENIKNNLCVNIANVIINLICGILVFVAALFIIKLILKILDIVDYIPVIGQLNKILGGVLGILEIIVIAWVVFVILRVLENVPQVSAIVEAIKNSSIAKVIYENNLVYNFMSNFFTIFKK